MSDFYDSWERPDDRCIDYFEEDEEDYSPRDAAFRQGYLEA